MLHSHDCEVCSRDRCRRRHNATEALFCLGCWRVLKRLTDVDYACPFCGASMFELECLGAIESEHGTYYDGVGHGEHISQRRVLD